MNILPQTKVQVIMMLPNDVEGKRTSIKVSCKGVVQKTEFLSSQPKEQTYSVEVLLSELSKLEKKMIAALSENF